MPKKNPDNLYQRKGVWYLRYNVNGKKQRISLKTRHLKEAKRLRDEFLAQRGIRARLGLPEVKKAAPVLTFAQVAQKWLDARIASGSLRSSTIASNRRVIKGVLLPVFGNMLMSAITVEHIEHFIGKLRTTLKRTTVADYFSTFRTIMRQSIKRGWFAGPNPLERLERLPTEGPGRDTVLTEAEASDLLAELTGRLYSKVALALYTGLRWGEVHGLAWADLSLDTDAPTLAVKRSFRGPPKNEASAATIPLNKEAAALLRRWRAQQTGNCPWVFPTIRGTIMARRSRHEAKAIHQATAHASITKRITPHVFRHTFGTWIYERTGDPKLVQRLMRHASFKTSMKYVHDRRSLAPVVDLLPDLTSRSALRVA